MTTVVVPGYPAGMRVIESDGEFVAQALEGYHSPTMGPTNDRKVVVTGLEGAPVLIDERRIERDQGNFTHQALFDAVRDGRQVRLLFEAVHTEKGRAGHEPFVAVTRGLKIVPHNYDLENPKPWRLTIRRAVAGDMSGPHVVHDELHDSEADARAAARREMGLTGLVSWGNRYHPGLYPIETRVVETEGWDVITYTAEVAPVRA